MITVIARSVYDTNCVAVGDGYKTIYVTNLNSVYTMFKLELNRLGYSFNDPQYERLFQIVTELVLINVKSTSPYTELMADDSLLEESVCEELEYSIHSKILNGIDIGYNLAISMLGVVAASYQDNAVYHLNEDSAFSYMPIIWNRENENIMLHTIAYSRGE
jgi:hypothetical protein